MREIKFRAWDFQNNEMIHGVGITPESDLCVPYKINPTPNNPEYLDYYPESTLMQFTGLHDKNGREIYEGDIYHQGDPKITYTVVWADTGMKGKQNGSSSYAGLSHWADRIEVIGNIHENPELLNG